MPLPMKLEDQRAEARGAIQLRDGFRGSGIPVALLTRPQSYLQLEASIGVVEIVT